MTNSVNRPQLLIHKILLSLTKSETILSFAGDLDEEFQDILLEKGYFTSSLWYTKQILLLMASCLCLRLFWNIRLLQNYAKTAMRYITRRSCISTINILGLIIGLLCSFLIYLYVSDEISFDKFHEKADSIYALSLFDYYMTRKFIGPPVTAGPALEEFYPEIIHSVRIHNFCGEAIVKSENTTCNEIPLLTDPEFFEVFSFPLIRGQPGTVLQADDSLVLTKRASRKYFGDANPIGKPLKVTFGENHKIFTVTGVAENPPGASTIQFDLVARIESLSMIMGEEYMRNGLWFETPTFLVLKEGSTPEVVTKKLDAFRDEYFVEILEERKQRGMMDSQGRVFAFGLQSIKDIHFNADIVGTFAVSNFMKSCILIAFALIILLIAIINFINLSLAQASDRSVEIGVRKALGADRKQLMRQFWIESSLLAFLSMAFATALAKFMLPFFNRLTQKNLDISALFTGKSILFPLSLVILVGIGAGSVPAFIKSKLKGKDIFLRHSNAGLKSQFSKPLVAVEFCLCVVLVISSYTMSKQIRYLTNEKLGFDKEGMIVVKSLEQDGKRSESILNQYKQRVLANRMVKGVSACFSPFGGNSYTNVNHDGERIPVHFNRVHFDYFKNLGIEFLAGRDFSKASANDAGAVIVNQKFVECLGLENPIGESVDFTVYYLPPLKIIGVVENHNYQPLNQEIGPAAFGLVPDASLLPLSHILVRISPSSIPETIAFLGNSWKEIQPEKPFLFSFLDKDIEEAYLEQKKWNTMVWLTTLIVIVICCLSLSGLMSIILRSRMKEIGIRRIMGAKAAQLYKLIFREFATVILAANLISWPIAYLIMGRWLSGFAYRTHLNIIPFIMASLIMLATAMGVCSIFVFRTTRINPIENLAVE